MTDLELSKFKKVLIIRLSSLGDILLTTPFIRAIKIQCPNIKIDMLIKAEYADVIKLNPYIDKKLFFKKDNKVNNDLITQLGNNGYDLIIDLQNNLRSKKITSKIKSNSVRFSKNSWNKFLLVKFKINKLIDASQIPVRYAQALPGFQLDGKGVDLVTDKNPSDELKQKENLIGFCPGAKHFTKRWPKEYFIKLGKKLTQTGYTIVLFGGKIDKEICSLIAKEIPGSIDLSNTDDILQTTADMKLCKAVVCNDSGLMHTASAVEIKVAAIFGSTVKEFGFTPYNCSNLILENNSLTCRPCSHIGRNSCPKKHFECMQSIKPDFVFEKLISFISNK